MKKWKIIALMVIVLLAVLGVLGFVNGQERQQKLEAAREKLYLNWEAYLSFRNEIDTIQMWTMEHVECYSKEKTWENLIRARAALAAGEDALTQVEPPEMRMERAVIDALPNEEVILVTEMLSGAPMELQTVYGMFDNLQYILEDFFLYNLENIKLEEAVSFYQQELKFSERSNGCLTNHLFLTWNMKSKWGTLDEQYPAFATFMEEWESRDAVLLSRSETAMDEMERLYHEYANSLLYSDIMLEMVQKAVENRQYDELRRRIVRPVGMPMTQEGALAVFPSPAWLQEPSAVHYAVHEDEGIRLIKMGDDLSKLPTAVYYYYDHVTREEYEQYFAQLQQLGFEGILRDSTDAESMMLVVRGEYALAMQWSPFETVLALSNPMGCLVTPLDYELLGGL